MYRAALAEANTAALAELMNKNFDLRRSMFGDAALGATNLQMISLARSVGGMLTINSTVMLPELSLNIQHDHCLTLTELTCWFEDGCE